MTYTSLATAIKPTHQKSTRGGRAIRYIVLHHAATTSLGALDRLVAGARQVSAHLGVKDSNVHAYVPEEERAWSLASALWDGQSLTVEACNSSSNGSWPLSAATHETLARIVADWCRRYGIPCNRTHVIGHREVYTRHGASYATACPGGMDLDGIVRRAAQILGGAAPANVPTVGENLTSRPTADIQRLVGAEPDGEYGPDTTAKVKAWQKANGLEADGVWGPLSDAKGFPEEDDMANSDEILREVRGLRERVEKLLASQAEQDDTILFGKKGVRTDGHLVALVKKIANKVGAS